ncbi:hypothetical protein KKC17_03240 [Patescibacteria group bacterium]|nr:hypothetical protein [Patescibacteria group bacterium]
MRHHLTKLLAAALLLLGLTAFLHPSLGQLVYLDMFPGLIYLILGAVGLKLSYSKNSSVTLPSYLKILGFMGWALFLLGLSWPNFRDIFHLEPAENVWHLILGLAGFLLANKKPSPKL